MSPVSDILPYVGSIHSDDGHSSHSAQSRGAGLSIFLGPTASQIANAAAYSRPANSAGARFNPYGGDHHHHHLLAPQSDECKRLMSLFFLRLYPYHMHFYREFFLRDLHAGGGPYYSDLLMYAICSVAALVSKYPAERQRSELYARRAQGLLYDSGMDSPDITVLQALLLLSQREIGQGNGSKGWLFAGKVKIPSPPAPPPPAPPEIRVKVKNQRPRNKNQETKIK